MPGKLRLEGVTLTLRFGPDGTLLTHLPAPPGGHDLDPAKAPERRRQEDGSGAKVKPGSDRFHRRHGRGKSASQLPVQGCGEIGGREGTPGADGDEREGSARA
jgi:hypothetical protein